MKNLMLISFVFLFSFAGIQERSLKDITSITKNVDGKYNVLCGDGTQEVVNDYDVMNNNLCPYVAFDPKRVDILFVIDESGTMSTHQHKLSTHAGLIIEQLKILGYDYQIAVTTTGGWPVRNKFIDNSGHEVLTANTPDLKKALELNFDVGVDGSGTEKGFAESQKALENFTDAGFYRGNTVLHVVFFGDEGDQSAITSSDYKKFLHNFTNSNQAEQKYKVTAVNLFSEKCIDENKNGGPLPDKEAELVSLSGGITVDLCSNIYNLFY